MARKHGWQLPAHTLQVTAPANLSLFLAASGSCIGVTKSGLPLFFSFFFDLILGVHL
jgi:hypothetical protein